MIFSFLVVPFQVAVAEPITPELVADYKCEIILYRQAPAKGFSQVFMSSYSSGSHGGMSQTFGEGLNGGTDVVTVQASNNWMAMNWEQNGKVIANGLAAVSAPSKDYRVMILRNPNNLEEQVSLDCAPDVPVSPGQN